MSKLAVILNYAKEKKLKRGLEADFTNRIRDGYVKSVNMWTCGR